MMFWVQGQLSNYLQLGSFFVKRSWYKKPHERVLAFYLKKTKTSLRVELQGEGLPNAWTCQPAWSCLRCGCSRVPICFPASRSVTTLLSLCCWLATGRGPWHIPYEKLARWICPLLDRATGSGHPTVLLKGCQRTELQSTGKFGVVKPSIGLTMTMDVLIQRLILSTQTIASGWGSGLCCSALI